MRLLELRQPDRPGPVLEFHPNLTVINGLSPAARDKVIRAVQSLPLGVTPELAGLLEASGILFDLTPESLHVFGLSAEIDVTISAADLPDLGPSSSNGSSAYPHEDNEDAETWDDPNPSLESEPYPAVEEAAWENPEPSTPRFGEAVTMPASGVDAEELELANLAVADAEEAVATMQDALDRTLLERAAVSEARQRIEKALDKARRQLDAALARQEGAEGNEDAEREYQLREQIAEMQETVDSFSEEIKSMEDRDPRPIQVLIDALNEPQSTKMVPSKEAAALADDFNALQQNLDEVERRLQANGLSMDQISQHLEDSRAEVALSQKAVEKPVFTDDDVAELERAHEVVLEMSQKASGRVGRKAALIKMEEAQVKEQEILDRIGFPTWSSYVMGSSLLNIDPMAEQRLEQARDDLADAEKAWESLTAQLESDDDYRALLDRLEAVYLSAFDLLGGEVEGDLEERLRNHLVPDEDISKEDILEAMAYQLSLRDVLLDEGAGEDVIMAAAEEWLRNTDDHWEHYRSIQEDLVGTQSLLGVAQEELRALGGDPEDDSVESIDRRVAEAEARVADILVDFEAVSEIEGELDGQVEVYELMIVPSKASREAAYIRLEALQRSTDSAGLVATAPAPDIGAVAPGPPPSVDRRPEVYDDLPYAVQEDDDYEGEISDEWLEVVAPQDTYEYFLLGRLSALRNVSHAGSVPMVLDDPLSQLHRDDALRLLDKLDRVADSVQIIYLSDDPAIVSWAESLPIERGALVTANGELD